MLLEMVLSSSCRVPILPFLLQFRSTTNHELLCSQLVFSYVFKEILLPTRNSFSHQSLARHIRPTKCCTQFRSLRVKGFLVCCICMIMQHSHLNDMEILGTKRFIPKEFQLGTISSLLYQREASESIKCDAVLIEFNS